MKTINIAFSPCPNDTCMFHAMLHGYIKTGEFSFTPHIYDIEELNSSAFRGRYEVTKMSFHAYLHLKSSYTILDAGAALGFGCGPILVSRPGPLNLKHATIAVPGTYTTAAMLLRLWMPEAGNIVITRFDDIMPGISEGRFDAGVIIHEGRFTYPAYGLAKIIDLGEWWEDDTGLPIPLGCIAMKNDSGTAADREQISGIIRSSITFAVENRRVSLDYIRSHAQEMDDDVIDRHIRLYVNEFSVSLGEIGNEAINALEKAAQDRGIL